MPWTPTRRPALLAIAAAALLCAVTLLSLLPLFAAGFVYDDQDYLLRNPHLLDGWTLEAVRWAFTSFYAANWHPLTWLSHLADVSLFGFDPAPHHAVNVLLHALNAVVLFLFLRAATGHAGRSLFVALLFAVHPLHVETAAWVAERKDLLATLLWFLALGAYLRHVRRPDRRRLTATLLLFAAALSAKPMPVTLPLLLLLLDVWPLGVIPIGRDAPAGALLAAVGRRLRTVTLPLLALSLASSIVTLAAQTAAVVTLESLPPGLRLANAAISCVAYLRQTVWPEGLAVFYPHPGTGVSLPPAVAAATLLAAATAVAIRGASRRPHLAVGWLWFLVTLMPVIGLVQVGIQARADRYTYVPLVGIFVAVAYEACRAAPARPRGRNPLTVPALALIGLLAATTFRQAQFWRDGDSLYRHALEAGGESWIMHASLGETLAASGRYDEAIDHLLAATRIYPAKPELWFNLGIARLLAGAVEEAAADLRRALELRPDFPDALLYLGKCLAREGRRGAALEMYQRAVALRPAYADALLALGLALEELGLTDQALARLREALRSAPPSPGIAYALGVALTRLGDAAGGEQALREARRLAPSRAVLPGVLNLPETPGAPQGR